MTSTRIDPAVRRLVLYRKAAELAIEGWPESVIVQSLAFEAAADFTSTEQLRTIARRVLDEHQRRTQVEHPAVAS